MKVNVLVLCWVDDNGLISTYAYSTYEKAVEGACKILSDVILKNGEKRVAGNRILTLEQVKEMLSRDSWYSNYYTDPDDRNSPDVFNPNEMETERFWVRIDTMDLH